MEEQQPDREHMFEYERREDGSYAFYFRPPKLDLMPAETREHLRAAQKEVLLAFRSLVDAAIERQEAAQRGAQGPRKIEVT